MFNPQHQRVAYPVVANYVRNTWGKYGLVKSMLNSSTGLFSFQFGSMDGLNVMFENGPRFIRNHSLILKKWNPDVNLLQEDVGNVPVWVKLHGIPVTAFSEDGLSGRSSYARTMIELKADAELKDTIVVTMPKLIREGFYTCTVRVKYEWKPPRCACCKVFGHPQEECRKNLGLGVAKNMKKTSQAPKGFLVGSKMGLKPAKEYRPVSKNPTTNASGNKKNDVEPTNKVSNSNPFDVLNFVENDMDLESCSISTTLIIEKIGNIENLIRYGKVNLVKDEGVPVKKVEYSSNYDSEDEVASVDNDIARSMASEEGNTNNHLSLTSLMVLDYIT
uniref:DUF4283 domain-containing protein n=1 Tax=Tanacetum cinerariifolium TaxID=118510 RepID=A0A6L2MKQ2_TANCI|nr:hypothetical protein [Tanacetum cinerariifolium]